MNKVKVFKFGGASVKDATGVKNLLKILHSNQSRPLIVVISAMGKTTNALEKVVEAYFSGDKDIAYNRLEKIKQDHIHIVRDLFGQHIPQDLNDKINNLFVEVEWVLDETPVKDFDFYYDQIVSVGELLSTTIISEYLNRKQLKNQWIDARDLIKTDDRFRAANVNWDKTRQYASSVLKSMFEKCEIIVTQGFIGSTAENYTTTLGREGSDYTAAILANLVDAEEMIVWKDVPGLLNADPKIIPDAILMPHISYKEAIELTYYGATVIHPKTIKPLQNKNIPLKVKSFLDPEAPGTIIDQNEKDDLKYSSFIFRPNQVLMSFSARDYSFIAEGHLSELFGTFARFGVKINLIQISALNFTVSFDNQPFKLEKILQSSLQDSYKILYNTDCLLITLRHPTASLIKKMKNGKEIFLEQRSRNTFRMVVKANPDDPIYNKYQ